MTLWSRFEKGNTMKMLHILRSEPDDETVRLIEALSEGNRNRTLDIFNDVVDYDRLVQEIFAADRVISWW